MADTYDVIVIGSGAGGSAAAYKLVKGGKRVLLLEKGGRVPRDSSTLSTEIVFKEGRYRNQSPWQDGQGNTFVPEEFYNVGGKTKWYGAALLRFAPHEFEADPDYQCLAWPFGHEELEPYYAEAERLLHVNRFPNEPELQAVVDKIVAADSNWRADSLPLGLKPEILKDPEEAKHFDGFASVSGYKGEAERDLLDPIAAEPNFTLIIDKEVTGFLHQDHSPEVIEGVICADGSYFKADKVLLAAGAMTSPRLLQDYLAVTGLDKTLPCAALVGTYFKMHLNSALVAFSAFKNRDVLRKTAIFFNDKYPHSTVQCLGWLDGEILGAQLPKWVPQLASDVLGARAIGFFITTEDGSSRDNRVISNRGGIPILDYSIDRLPFAKTEHEAVIKDFFNRLLHAGMAGGKRFLGLAGSAHVIGSLVTGNDPHGSVVDADGKVHGMERLYVADGSILPRTSRVNPALSIFAWGLRLGHKLASA